MTSFLHWGFGFYTKTTVFDSEGFWHNLSSIYYLYSPQIYIFTANITWLKLVIDFPIEAFQSFFYIDRKLFIWDLFIIVGKLPKMIFERSLKWFCFYYVSPNLPWGSADRKEVSNFCSFWFQITLHLELFFIYYIPLFTTVIAIIFNEIL